MRNLFPLFFWFDCPIDIYCFRNGHPNRAAVIIFWVFCPMLVKLFMDMGNWIKNSQKSGIKSCGVGCGACTVMFFIITW